MQIFLKKFSLDPVDYQRFLFKMYLRKRWWIFLAFFILGLYMLSLGEHFISILAFVYVFIIPLCYYIYFGQYVRSPKNKIIFSEKTLSSNEDFIESQMEDGSSSKINWGNIIKAEHRDEYFLLFLSRNQFIPIPENSFGNNQDKIEFQQFLQTKGLLRK